MEKILVLAVLLVVVTILKAVMKKKAKPTEVQIDKTNAFLQAASFPVMVGVQICLGKHAVGAWNWKQGILLINDEHILLLGWTDVENMKNGILTGDNWKSTKLADEKSLRLSWAEVKGISIQGGGLKASSLLLQAADGREVSILLSKSLQEAPGKDVYKRFLNEISEQFHLKEKALQIEIESP